LTVKKSSPKKDFNLYFTAIASTDNYINAFDRVVNIELVGLNDSFQSRIASTRHVNVYEPAPVYQINDVDDDYFLTQNDYKDKYVISYRIGYYNSVDDDNYNMKNFNGWGKLLINSSNQIYLSTKN